jgi:hypothetical protein
MWGVNMKGIIIKTSILAMFLLLCSAEITFAQMQIQESSIDCETCTMNVGADAQSHLKVYDGNGTRHYVECIGCALKLLKTQDTLHIETYCDWYGPNYTVTADISGNGSQTTVSPSTALLLVGGGCTGNRVAYNQTAADELLSNGFSQYTMMMMQQALPANTNTTTITQRALSYVQNQEIQLSNSAVVIILIAIIGAILIIGSVIAFRKLKA